MPGFKGFFHKVLLIVPYEKYRIILGGKKLLKTHGAQGTINSTLRKIMDFLREWMLVWHLFSGGCCYAARQLIHLGKDAFAAFSICICCYAAQNGIGISGCLLVPLFS